MATIVLFVLFLCRKTHRDITLWCVMMRGVAGMLQMSANVFPSENDFIRGITFYRLVNVTHFWDSFPPTFSSRLCDALACGPTASSGKANPIYGNPPFISDPCKCKCNVDSLLGVTRLSCTAGYPPILCVSRP